MKKLLFTALIGIACLQVNAQEMIDAKKMEEVIAKPQTQLLDVRTAGEYAGGHIPNSVNVDWKEKEKFEESIKNLDKDQPVYVYCLGGGRSKQAAEFLTGIGFKVYDYSGGMMDWRSAEKPEIKPDTAKEAKGLSTEDFDKIINSSELVLVNFSAVWCAPCQELKPTIDKIEKEQAGKVKVVRIDADQNKNLMKVLNVRGIPQLILYKNAEQAWNKTGVATEAEILAQVKKAKK
ncbi:thioredoxin domain-containing protein [Sphingobacterium cellulitidis]|uniref:thioredoxin domain-containing protein n=1 Tax=Sphingobacterium cellulitidis TaxID=1768011 RepID=UPI003C7CBE4B